MMNAERAKRLLIVEDEPVLALDLRRRLKGMGYEVVGAVSKADDAYAAALEKRPDLVLMDIRLRGAEDGVSLAERLRDSAGPPVMFLTAHGDDATLARARDVGAFGLLLKPYDDDRLRTSVEIALRAGETHRRLRESETRFQLTLHSIGDAVFATDAEARVSFLNPAAEALSQWTAAEAIGRPLGDVFRIVDEATGANICNEFLDQVVREKQARLPAGAALVGRHGRRSPIEDCASMIVGADGVPLGAVFVVSDVTERRRLQADRDATMRRLALIIERMPIGCVVNAPDFTVTGWNKACERIFGYRAEEVIGKSPYETIVPPDAATSVSRIEDRIRAGDTAAHAHTWNRTKEGRSILCEWTNTPLVDENGRFLGFLAMVQDVTQQEANTRRLVERERMFSIAFEQAPTGMAMVEPAFPGRFIRVNKSLAQILGREPASFAGLSLVDVAHPEDHARDIARLREYFAGKTDRFETEKRFLRGDGQWVTCSVVATIVRDADGAPLYSLSHFVDLTERMAAENERRRLAERSARSQQLETLGALAGGVAHDFNNMLAAIRGFASTAELCILDHDRAGAALRDIHDVAQQAGELCRQLLQYAGQNEGEKTVVSIASLINSMRPLLQAAIAPGVSLAFDIDQVDPFVSAELGSLRQLVLNLVVNAAEACDGREGQVAIGVKVVAFDAELLSGCVLPEANPAGPRAAIEVRDNGVGMSADTLSRAFDPFFSTKGPSRGFGLATTLGVVRRHHGNLIVESTPGEGARFRVFFPVVDRPSRASLAPAMELGHALVVDDDTSFCESLKEPLRSMGLFPVVVSDWHGAQLALSTTPEKEWTLAIVDLSVLAPDGRSAVRALRASYPSLRILAISGGDLRACHGEPMDPLLITLQKPFSFAELASRIAELSARRGLVGG